jgi:LysM repeat protein
LPDRGKSRIRIIVFAIIAAHVFMLGVFLIAGCKKTSTETAQQEPAPPPVTPPVEPPPLPPAFTNVPATPGSSATATAPVPADTNVVLPPPPPSPIESIPPPAFSEHTIIKGETFAVLAKRYGVTTKAIEAANPGVNPTRLKIGQKIKIPPPKPATNGTASGNGLATTDGAEKTYTVKSGDNLMKIAKSFGVTVKQLRCITIFAPTRSRSVRS